MSEDLGRGSSGKTSRLSPTLVPALVLQLIALILHSYVSSEVLPTDWNQQVSALLVVSSILSVVLGFSTTAMAKVLITLLKIVIYGFITFPPGGHLTVEMPVAVALAIEITAAFTSPLSWLLVLVAVANGLLFDTVLFTIEESSTTIVEIVLSYSAALVAAYLADIVKRAKAVEARSKDVIARLDGAVRQLTEANVSLQEYAARSSSEERWRISRDVHDAVGYALTNLRMMMELAQRITPDGSTELKEIHRRGVEQARQGINDVRAALGALRASEPRRLLGQQGVTRLVKSFENATGVTVRIEYGNARESFGQRIDAAVYRLVQEGLTNALRHGEATHVDIYFWERDGQLEVNMEDNGEGSKDVADGIGISGMRERIESLGGIVERSNSPVGFRLSATVPVSSDDSGREE